MFVGSPEDFRRLLAAELEVTLRVIKAAELQPE